MGTLATSMRRAMIENINQGEHMGNNDVGETSAEVSKPIEAFDFFDPEVQSDPYEFYKTLQAKCPVYKVPDKDIYVVSRYDDLNTALRDYSTFSSVMERALLLQGANGEVFKSMLREGGWEHVPTLQRSDPPQHARYRKVIDRAFNVRQVRELQPRLDALANELVDKFIDQGETDFIEDFALPFSGIIAAELIGLDARDYQKFRAWADNLQSYSSRVLSLEELKQAARTEIEMQHFFAAVFEDRRKAPRDDLMTTLVSAYEGEAPLSMEELQNIMHQLISGGYETVKSALSHGMWQMVRFPEVVAAVKDDRSLLPGFINESLRWESPVQGLWRIATRDAEVAGTTIPKGALCNMRYGAGDRDASMFPEPEKFDIRRKNAAHNMAFGRGTHFCPGAALARAELTAAYSSFLDRMEDFQLAAPLPYPVHSPSAAQFPMKELKVKFRKRAQI